jgi:hypothetical protein
MLNFSRGTQICIQKQSIVYVYTCNLPRTIFDPCLRNAMLASAIKNEPYSIFHEETTYEFKNSWFYVHSDYL